MIETELRDEGNAPLDTSDETSYDSDEYPKYASDDEENDSPVHCAAGPDCVDAITLPSGHKIGCLIGYSLTSHGLDYARHAVAIGGEVADLWATEFEL
jgi:hypothetical protein